MMAGWIYVSGSGSGPMTGSFQHGNEFSGSCSTKGGEFFNNILTFYLSMAPQPLRTLTAFFSFLIYIQSVDSLDGGSARRKAATYTQNNTNTDIHALNGIQTYDPSVRAGADGSLLRQRGHCDWLSDYQLLKITLAPEVIEVNTQEFPCIPIHSKCRAAEVCYCFPVSWNSIRSEPISNTSHLLKTTRSVHSSICSVHRKIDLINMMALVFYIQPIQYISYTITVHVCVYV
jgi:hypothetical protein